jgi:aldose 1-epimerase
MIERIENDFWQLEIAPEIGASVLNLRGRVTDRFEPIMRHTDLSALEKHSSSALSSFILAPFSNRIRGAKFGFSGREYQLKTTTPDGNTQHGDVRNRAWTVVKHDSETLEGWFDSRSQPDFNFPWPITMNVVYELEENVLETRLEMRNVSPEPMPAGFGLHPYFVRTLPGSSDVVLGFHAGGVYETDDELMPTQAMKPVPPVLDFSSPRAVGIQQLNHGFGAWDGHASLTYPDSGVRVVIEADPIFSHLVAFTSPDGSMAIEPVTNATDGFNLAENGVPGTGVVILEPGAVMTGTVRLKLETEL